MDGVHDLGGRQGFGPIAMQEDERPFKSDWEARMWGLNGTMSGDPGWTLDWWRHVRELIEPIDYLRRPYFDQWMQIYAALMVDSGHATVEELASGKAAGPAPDLGPPIRAEAVAGAMRQMADFRRDWQGTPAFAVGQEVMTRCQVAAAHTRLPSYARGRRGVVQAHCGAFVVPDEMARGREVAEPLYTVAFAAAELWPEAEGEKTRVFLDLWERYLET